MLAFVLFAVFALATSAAQSDGCEPTPTTVSGTAAPKGTLCKGQLLLNENFDLLDSSLWKHEVRLTGQNGEFQWYTDDPANAFITGGVLNLMPTLTTDVIPDLTACNIIVSNCTDTGSACKRTCSHTNIAPPVRSALLRTMGTFNFKYGRVTIRAKLPSGKWLWPALWFMPANKTYGGWPKSGEIDLMESKGNPNMTNSNGANVGSERFGSTLHFGTAWNMDAYWAKKTNVHSAAGDGFDTAFHDYGLEWSPDYIQISLDGVTRKLFTTGDGYYAAGHFKGGNPWIGGGKDAPFDQEFFLKLNNAVGGTNGYFADGLDNKPWANSDGIAARSNFWNGRGDWLPTWNFDASAQMTAALQVDSIRVYAL